VRHDRRAATLHRLAHAVVEDHRGRLPADAAELVKLPGIGPYTAGAVSCFAFERKAAAVDTNVARVLRRYFGANGGATAVRRLALQLQPRRGRAAWVFNQAVMELGALICVARRPRCGECPVRAGCVSVRTSRPTRRPRRG
jgi:A/G-specific adenine glycosylase